MLLLAPWKGMVNHKSLVAIIVPMYLVYPRITIPMKGKVSDYYIAGACCKSEGSKESVRDFFMNSRSRTPTKKTSCGTDSVVGRFLVTVVKKHALFEAILGVFTST